MLTVLEERKPHSKELSLFYVEMIDLGTLVLNNKTENKIKYDEET